MSDNRHKLPGQQVGTGRRRGYKPVYDQSVTTPWQHVTPVDQMINGREALLSGSPALGDAPNFLYEVGSRVGEGPRKEKKDVIYDRPISMAVAKAQTPDLQCYSFDDEARAFNCPPGSISTVLSISISQGVRGIMKRFSWFTNAAGQNALLFGLYVGSEIVAPGGKFVSSSPRLTTQYDPTGGSNSFNDMAECSIPIIPETNVTIQVTNTDPINAHLAWGRMWGWTWEEETREAGERSYYNRKLGKVK
jgi:hypothetical protein